MKKIGQCKIQNIHKCAQIGVLYPMSGESLGGDRCKESGFLSAFLGPKQLSMTHLWKRKAYSTQICTKRSRLINLVAVEGLFMAGRRSISSEMVPKRIVRRDPSTTGFSP